jgi:hypothetical protein
MTRTTGRALTSPIHRSIEHDGFLFALPYRAVLTVKVCARSARLRPGTPRRTAPTLDTAQRTEVRDAPSLERSSRLQPKHQRQWIKR